VTKEQYEAWSRTIAFLLKLVGVLGIIGIPIFWALTNRIELAFLPFFGTLAGVGQGLDVLREISQGREGGEPGSELSGAEPSPQLGSGETTSADVPPPPKPRAKRKPRARRPDDVT
jgi:hypothetical protein